MVDGAIGFVIGGLEFGQWGGGLAWAAVEEAVSKRTADALVKEYEEQGDAGSFVGEAIGVAAAVARQEPEIGRASCRERVCLYV